jgi:antitoxin component YwqK of YwqJK toxin-antitoxin module
MKITGLLFLLFTSHYVFAQKTEAFYDYFWKPTTPENARYFSIIEKTDSGWLHSDYYISTKQLQMRALFADEAGKIRNGNSLYFFANGRPSVVGRIVNNKQEGVCVRYHSNGMLSDSAFFRNGQVVDTRFRWHRNGYIADSIRKVNDSMYVQVG